MVEKTVDFDAPQAEILFVLPSPRRFFLIRRGRVMNVSAYVLLNVDIEELLSHKLLFSIQSTPKLTFYCFFDFCGEVL